jgi:hypothetical protein
LREVVFLLEEESAKVLIEGIITKIRGNDNKEPQCKYIVFEGKRDLQKKLFKKLNGYCNQEAVFIINAGSGLRRLQETKTKAGYNLQTKQ